MPVFFGYLAVSFAFGIMAKSLNITSLGATVMSAANFTSAGQFAAVSGIAAGMSYLELALSQLVINLRYCLMSSALSQKISEKAPFYHRFFMAFGNTDEVFALAVSYKGELTPAYYYGLMTAALPGWVAGTALGVLSGGLLPVRVLSALGIALYAMFIAIIIPPAKKNKIVALTVGLSMAASYAFSKIPGFKNISSGFKIIILTVALSALAAAFFPVETEEKGEQ
ncbi:MAG: AzlC family ABC transporter permease [Clostridia bacterium]|nr:AzlC family ABC transporter permease [Clostridia bacterium]